MGPSLFFELLSMYSTSPFLLSYEMSSGVPHVLWTVRAPICQYWAFGVLCSTSPFDL